MNYVHIYLNLWIYILWLHSVALNEEKLRQPFTLEEVVVPADLFLWT